MPESRTFRVILLGTLITATLSVLLWSAWLFWPQRDETIQAALRHSSGPAFWWPPSWRSEFQAVRGLIDCLTLTGGDIDAAIESAQSINEGRAAVEPLIELLKHENDEVRAFVRMALASFDRVATQSLIRTLECPRISAWSHQVTARF